MNRIERKFRALKKQDKKAFIAFITAGYPNLGVTRELVLEFDRIGVDIIELGVPFSDPLADGPVIQEASQAALSKGVDLCAIFKLVRDIRKKTEIPLCLMTYYNPVFCFGEEKFAKEASLSGVDGVIIPDLPPEEGSSFVRSSRKYNLDTVFFLSPTTTPKRAKFVSGVSRGFIYYVSLTGVTGPRQELPKDLVNNLRIIKKLTNKPVCVGFGISNLGQVKAVYKIADGAIVGSAIIKEIKKNSNRPDLVKRTGRFVQDMMA